MKNSIGLLISALLLGSGLSSGLSSCASNGASHLPSPLELPGAIIGSVIENTSYNAKRRKVESYVAMHYLAIRQDALQGGGKSLEGALNVARVKGQKRAHTTNELVNSHSLHFRNGDKVRSVLINHFAALYLAKQEDKKINGFSYTEAKLVISEFANQHFEPLRLSIKNNQGDALDQLASKLNMTDVKKRTQFIKQAQSNYKAIYLEPVVVLLMVHSN